MPKGPQGRIPSADMISSAIQVANSWPAAYKRKHSRNWPRAILDWLVQKSVSMAPLQNSGMRMSARLLAWGGRNEKAKA